MEPTSASGVSRELLLMLNEKAQELKMERETLRLESKKLQAALAPLEEFDALPLQNVLSRFSELAREAEPTKLQRLPRATVSKIVWKSENEGAVEQVVDFYSLPASKCTDINDQTHLEGWLERNERTGCPRDRDVEPVFLIVPVLQNTLIQMRTALFRAH